VLRNGKYKAIGETGRRILNAAKGKVTRQSTWGEGQAREAWGGGQVVVWFRGEKDMVKGRGKEEHTKAMFI